MGLAIAVASRWGFGRVCGPHAAFGQTSGMSCRRAIQRLDSASSVSRCAAFFCRPRKRTFIKPNWRLLTRNGCSTFARTLRLAMFALLSNRLGSQAICIAGCQVEPCLAMALSMVSSLRMQATKATFLRLPTASRRS